MDPNLSKIKEANLHDIRNGKMGTAIAHATSYLSYVLMDNWDKIDRELTAFKINLLEERTPHGSKR